MMTVSLRRTLAVSLALVLEVACGGGSSPTSPSSQSTTTGPPVITLYSGVVSVNSDGKSAALVLKTSVPTTIVGGVTQQKSTGAVTASLNTADGGTVSLTGTFTKTTGIMTVQGGGYQFTATAHADGSVTGAGTFGGSAGLLALSAPGSPLSVSAAAVTSTASVQPYCGTYNGFYKNNVGPGNPEGGSFCLTVSGTRVWGSAPAS